MLIPSKGVGDCIEAVAEIRRAGGDVELSLAGSGEVAPWENLARRLDVGPSVRLLGVIPSERVLAEMRDHDAVVVPSRHDFAEGLPNTVFEALASRSPLIASDHPAFARRLRPGTDSLQFPAGNPTALAGQVRRLAREPGLYARLSEGSAEALAGLYVGIEWTDLVGRFLDDPDDARGWVAPCSLAALPDGLGTGGAPAPGVVSC